MSRHEELLQGWARRHPTPDEMRRPSPVRLFWLLAVSILFLIALRVLP